MTAAHLDEFIILSAVRASQIRLAIYTNFKSVVNKCLMANKFAASAAPFVLQPLPRFFQILKFKVNFRI